MKYLKILIITGTLFALAEQTSAQRMIGATVARTNSLLNYLTDYEDQFGPGYSVGISFHKWKPRRRNKENKFKMRTLSFQYGMLNDKADQDVTGFIDGNIVGASFEWAHGWILGDYEADDPFYPYFVYSFVLGGGKITYNTINSRNEPETEVWVNAFCQPYNLGFGLSKSVLNKTVLRLEAKVLPTYNFLNSFTILSSLQASVLFRLY